MIYENTTVKGFILLGFSEFPDSQVLLFFGFLIVYSLCILENTFLIALIYLNSQLHTPMYFFICNLSFLDICLTTLIHPKFLLTFLNMRSISFHECMGQLYLYIALQSLEYLLLTVMSYDRYVAICNPLHYNIILNKKSCVLLSAVTWMISLVDPAPIMRLVTKLPFCKSHKIDHLFCDSVPLLKLSCGSIFGVGVVIAIEGIFLTLPAFLLTVSSYISIISVILKIQSAKGRLKAFSTCSSHLTVVTMLYLTLTCIYFVPPSNNTSVNNSKAVSLLNIVVIPMLNPLLYSLRNKDVKNAFLRLVKQTKNFI
ncbi:olfactory receptor 8I2-like [Hyla sarda]|uniref:olfactory receptor 8I2-like n=1 Tax=Hyla sarda TaxID=327740 RepID=UPI0024C2371E|nr:olfactory receptor 8I2-like [Hyla sarda]